MKAGTHNRKYQYIPPEQRVGKKESERRLKAIVHKAMREKCPEFALAEDYLSGTNAGHYF